MSADTIRIERECTLGEATIRTVVEVPAHMGDVAEFVAGLLGRLDRPQRDAEPPPNAGGSVAYRVQTTPCATAAH